MESLCCTSETNRHCESIIRHMKQKQNDSKGPCSCSWLQSRVMIMVLLVKITMHRAFHPYQGTSYPCSLRNSPVWVHRRNHRIVFSKRLLVVALVLSSVPASPVLSWSWMDHAVVISHHPAHTVGSLPRVKLRRHWHRRPLCDPWRLWAHQSMQLTGQGARGHPSPNPSTLISNMIPTGWLSGFLTPASIFAWSSLIFTEHYLQTLF